MKKGLLTKRRWLVAGALLALCLTVLVPATVMAGPPIPDKPVARQLNAVLTTAAIDNTYLGSFWPARDNPAFPEKTNVWPIVDVTLPPTPPFPGAIVGWIVDGRSIYGSSTGDVNGPFAFTYGGIVNVLQSGSIQGTVVIQTAQGCLFLTALGNCVTKIINPTTMSAVFSGTFSIDSGTGIYSGVKGKGTFAPAGAPLTFTLDPDGIHVTAIEGAIKITGIYTQKKLLSEEILDKDKIRDWWEKFRR